MANYHLEIFTTLLFLFSFLPPLASACRLHCDSDGPPVRFPFSIIDYYHEDSSLCGLVGFGLSCNKYQKQTLLSLPSYGIISFIVDDIDYADQIVTINDIGNCFIAHFVYGVMNPSPKPFSYLYDLGNYTFFEFLPETVLADPYRTVSCLSDDYSKVVVAETSMVPSPLDLNCSVISTALVPIGPSGSSELEGLNYGVQLKWDDPDCKACSAAGQGCGILSRSVSGLQVRCLPGSKFARIASVLGLVLSGVLWLVVLAWRLTRISTSSSRSTQRPANTEMSTLTIDGQLPVAVAGGLDQKTIDSYPKKQLGESREFTSSGENACPICLGEYEAMETVRTIPECNHYFHANCINNWLRRNPACPVCRTLPEGERVKALIN